jgi:outer membrane protein OmpA-like peptidoglycan-associated protein
MGGGTESQASFTSDETEAFVGHAVSVRVLGDGGYLKVYADGRRLANVPNASFARGRGIFVALEGRDEESNAVYVTRIRVAESQKTVYDALATAGRWATQGILFETAKSLVRPESAPTLKEIAAALTQHPELRIRIEGHTDNVGNADANLRLSEARAAAVKDALVREYRIDAARLETAGLGDTKPVADNKTAEGRSSNRRVEVVKL